MKQLVAARLSVVQDNDVIQEFVLTHDLFTIGRSIQSQLLLESSHVQPVHAEIDWETDQYRITPSSSTAQVRCNGTLLQPQTPYPLTNGDVIQIGEIELHFHQLIEQFADKDEDEVHPMRSAETQAPIKLSGQDLLYPVIEYAEVIKLRDRHRLTLGRDAANDTVVDHPTVSRWHAEITLLERQKCVERNLLHLLTRKTL